MVQQLVYDACIVVKRIIAQPEYKLFKGVVEEV